VDVDIESLIKQSPDPQSTELRLQRLNEDAEIRKILVALPPPLLKDLISIISISNFLFLFLCRHPQAITLIGQKSFPVDEEMQSIGNLDELRLYKYRELLKISWMDISRTCDYREILGALSALAVTITRHAIRLSLDEPVYRTVMDSMTVMALGKLGANELNYSSDIDLIFLSANPGPVISDYQELQKTLFDCIRELNRTLEEKTVTGFLYRVDLRLRPWGNSGPLVMSVDDTEHYYEASAEPWERFAWLRARAIAGSENLGSDLLQRMRPYIFMRSLSTDDLNRFIEIKKDMGKARKKQAHWNIKVGEGGIRDIEFFLQILQVVNAAKHEELQTTNTLIGLAGLKKLGLIDAGEEQEIYQSYIFLRRLENRLQMFDEKQTHSLPDDQGKRLILARSLGQEGNSDDEILNNFEIELIASQTIAEKYFDRVLPEQSG